MKTIKYLLTITGIYMLLSLLLVSCGTTKKPAVSCPVVSGNKYSKVAYGRKLKRNKTYITQDRINIRKQATVYRVRLPVNLHGEDIDKFKKTPFQEYRIIPDMQYPNGLSTTECVYRLKASNDNDIIPSGRTSSTVRSKENRDMTQKSKDLAESRSVECDTIFLKSGSLMIVKIIEIGRKTIKYRNCDTKGGLITSIPRSEVSMIKSTNVNYAIFESPDSVSINEINSTRKTEGLGKAGFTLSLINLSVAAILGIFSLILSHEFIIVFFWYNFMLLFVPLFGLTGLIFGCISLSRIRHHPDKYKGKSIAKTSIIIGIVAIIASIIVWVVI